MIAGLDKLQSVFLVCAALFIVFETVQGWRRGIVRQLSSMAAIVAAYLTGIFGGKLAAPVLRPLGYPDMVTSAVAGCVLGLFVMFSASVLSALLFKKTSQQSMGLIRFFYGLGGASMGFIVGLFFVWLAMLGTRVLGIVAESEIHPARSVQNRQGDAPLRQPEPGRLVGGLAALKHSLDREPTGPVFGMVDPVPRRSYSILEKIVLMVANGDVADRFFNYPGTKALASNRSIAALSKDPAIVEAIRNHNYLVLLRNEHVVQAANDPEIVALIRKFELEKALDYALKTDGQKTSQAVRN